MGFARFAPIYVIFSISGLFGIILSLIEICHGWFGIERYSQGKP